MRGIILVAILLLTTACSNNIETQRNEFLGQIEELQAENDSLIQDFSKVNEDLMLLNEDVIAYEEEIIAYKNKIIELEEANMSLLTELADEEISYIKGAYWIDGGEVNIYDEEILSANDQYYFAESFIDRLYNYPPRESEVSFRIKGEPIIDHIYLLDSKVEITFDSLDNLIGYTGVEDPEEMRKIELDGLNGGYGIEGGTLHITSDNYMTSRGITVGSTREEVQRAYGIIGEYEDEYWGTFLGNAEYGSREMRFKFIDNMVVEIRIYIIPN